MGIVLGDLTLPDLDETKVKRAIGMLLAEFLEDGAESATASRSSKSWNLPSPRGFEGTFLLKTQQFKSRLPPWKEMVLKDVNGPPSYMNRTQFSLDLSAADRCEQFDG